METVYWVLAVAGIAFWLITLRGVYVMKHDPETTVEAEKRLDDMKPWK